MFLTFFPHAYPYVVALTPDPEGEFGQLLASVEGDINPSSIYIVEDSMVDLGLIVAVERNWDRFMELVTDYLTWLTTPVEEVVEEEKKEREAFVVEFPDIPPPVKRKSLLGRLVGKVKGIFSKKKSEPDPSSKDDAAEGVTGDAGEEVPSHVDAPDELVNPEPTEDVVEVDDEATGLDQEEAHDHESPDDGAQIEIINSEDADSSDSGPHLTDPETSDIETEEPRDA
jgi:hypothetical protein